MVNAIAVTYRGGVYTTADLSGTPTWAAGNNTGLLSTLIYQATICNDKTIYALPLDTDGVTILGVCKQTNGGNWDTILTIADIVTLLGVGYADPTIIAVDADEDNSDYVAVMVWKKESFTNRSGYMLYSVTGGASWSTSVVFSDVANAGYMGNVQIGGGLAFCSYRVGKNRFMSNTFPPVGAWTLDLEPANLSAYWALCVQFDNILYWQYAYDNSAGEPAFFHKDLPSGSVTLSSIGATASGGWPAIARLSDLDVVVISDKIYSSTDKLATLTLVSEPTPETDMVFKYPLSDELVFARWKNTESGACLWYSDNDGATLTDITGAIPEDADGLTLNGFKAFAGTVYVRNVEFSDVTEIAGEPLPNSQGAWDVDAHESYHASDLSDGTTTKHHLPAATLSGGLAISQGNGTWVGKAISGDGTLTSAGVLDVTHADEADHATEADHADEATDSDQFGGIALADFGFLDLNDTPVTYAGQGGKVVSVRADETALEFTVSGSGGSGGDTNITFQSRFWTADGPLAVAEEVGGVHRCLANLAISQVSFYLFGTGSSGSTIIDVDVSVDGGATWSSLFTTPALRPQIAAGASDKRASSVPDVVRVYYGSLLRVNLDQVATGARGLSVQLDGEVVVMQLYQYTVALVVANTEYSQALPAGVRAYGFQARTNVEIRWAKEAGKVGTPTESYGTVKAGHGEKMENLVGAAVTLYFASSTAGTVVEVQAWA